MASAMLGRASKFGFQARTLVHGWSSYNTRPFLRAGRIEPEDAEFEFQPGTCLSIVGYVSSADERMGVWIGDTSIVTEDGVRNLQKLPIDQLDYVTIT